MVFGGFSRGFQELVHYSYNFIRVIRIINFMLKKMQPEKICVNCGKIIRNRRADAKMCIDCRRKAQEESSRRIKAKEKEERIMNKVEMSGVKRDIEYKKVREILENLEKGTYIWHYLLHNVLLSMPNRKLFRLLKIYLK